MPGAGAPPRPPRKSANPCKIFVGNLTWDTDETKLSEFMCQAGTIVSTEIIRQRNGRSVGSGLVTFSTPEEASGAVASFNGLQFDGRDVICRADKGGN
jgi:polyadenylate-binding protein